METTSEADQCQGECARIPKFAFHYLTDELDSDSAEKQISTLTTHFSLELLNVSFKKL